jgi:hypothetical protein
MPENDFISTMLEALLEQTKAIRDVKIQSESLKNMMFEHRPAFVPAFEEQVKKATASPALRELDSMITRLESALRVLRNG